jgi:hypothetical protein
MKRLLLGIALIMASAAAFGQGREVLLTPDGTLYTVEVVSNETAAGTVLSLPVTIKQGKTVTTTVVPESLSGVNIEPALAYDSDSQTLFVFWLRQPPNSSANELNLATYQNGKWQPAMAFDSRPGIFQARFNLRIGVTHRVAQLQTDGTFLDVQALLVHAVWWEYNSVEGEAARYSLIPIEKGIAGTPDTHALGDFVNAQTPAQLSPNFNYDLLRHPSLVQGSAADSIDVVFGDIQANVLNRITLKPVADAHIHIPVGVRGGNPINVPKAFSNDWTGDVTTLDGRDGRMVFANTMPNGVAYMMYAKGQWSPLNTIAIDEKISVDAAMAAVSRMLASQ